MFENYCAEIDNLNIVKNVIVCDDIDWVRSRLPGVWIYCGSYLPAIGETRTQVEDAIGGIGNGN